MVYHPVKITDGNALNGMGVTHVNGIPLISKKDLDEIEEFHRRISEKISALPKAINKAIYKIQDSTKSNISSGLCSGCGWHWASCRCTPSKTEPPMPLPEPIDPLDVEYDGVKLRTLIDGDAFNRQEQGRGVWKAKAMTQNQRAAVSAHWSAQLRTKVKEAKQVEVNQVMMPIDAEDLEW